MNSTQFYYTQLFPKQFVQETILQSGDYWLRFNYFPGKGESDGSWIKTTDLDSSNLFSCCEAAPTAEMSAVALHLGSNVEKPFVLDFDMKAEENVNYAACVATHQDKTKAFCPNCWAQLVAEASFYERLLLKWYESKRLDSVLTFEDLTHAPTWRPILWCFSGNRGLHGYAHPTLGLQFLDGYARQQILLHLRAAYQTSHSQTCLDLGASASASGITRLVFSPHLKSDYVCMPISRSLATDRESARLPYEICARWKPPTDSSNAAEEIQTAKFKIEQACVLYKDWTLL